MKILVMGLSGSRKSTFAKKLTEQLNQNSPAEWLNADALREQLQDWDFSEEGRRRQAVRMGTLADEARHKGIHTVCDFICPTRQLRDIFKPEMLIFMDTVKSSKFPDTDALFEAPTVEEYDFRLTETDDLDKWAQTIADLIYILE
jgi:adenylylsulfate kinase